MPYTSFDQMQANRSTHSQAMFASMLFTLTYY
jgi:hypothetical protein